MVMTWMNFFVPYLDRHHFLDHIRDYESSSTLVGLFKTDTDHANNFYLDVSIAIKAFSSPSGC